MSSTISTIKYITQEFDLYAGFFLFLTGLVGNTLNVFMFSDKRLRQSSCSWYLNAASLVNILYMFVLLITHIIGGGFQIVLSERSSAWCKTCFYLIQSLPLSSLTNVCLASIDRHLSSSRNANLRQLSTVRNAQIAITINVIFNLILATPSFVYFDIYTSATNTMKSCLVQNYAFHIYGILVVNTILCGVLPALILSIFGFLTAKSIRISRQRVAPFQQQQELDLRTRATTVQGQIRHQIPSINQQTQPSILSQMENQLNSIVLLQVIVIIISVVPFALKSLYLLITFQNEKSLLQLAYESLVTEVTLFCWNISYASGFYVYLAASSSFRQRAKALILRL